MAHSGSVGVNQVLRQELLALVGQDHAFVGAPDADPNSDRVDHLLAPHLDTLPWGVAARPGRPRSLARHTSY